MTTIINLKLTNNNSDTKLINKLSTILEIKYFSLNDNLNGEF